MRRVGQMEYSTLPYGIVGSNERREEPKTLYIQVISVLLHTWHGVRAEKWSAILAGGAPGDGSKPQSIDMEAASRWHPKDLT